MKKLPILGEHSMQVWSMDNRPTLDVDLSLLDGVARELGDDDDKRKKLLAGPSEFLKENRIEIGSGRLFDRSAWERQQIELQLARPQESLECSSNSTDFQEDLGICSVNAFCNVNAVTNVNVVTKVLVELAFIAHAVFLVKTETRVTGIDPIQFSDLDNVPTWTDLMAARSVPAVL